ncbi:MAG: hypothetical protein ACERKX_09165 [Anaerolineales bacterium]
MNTKNRYLIILPLIVMTIAALACGLPKLSSQEDFEIAVQQTIDAGGDSEIEAAVAPDEGEGEPEEVAVQPSATEEPVEEPTPTPTVAHQVYPSNPGGADSWVSDRSSAALASERRAIGDNFDHYLLERPFTSQVMDYQDYLDITRGELYASIPWVYITIFLEGSPPSDFQAQYGVEVDQDLDGRGDWFIVGQVPAGSDWTTDHVLACRDTNNDVGGPRPILSDAPNTSRDGYDDCVFDNGYGIGPDEAWIRRDPSHADRIQLAFKHSLIGSDNEFLWGPWADEGVRDPSMMDYNDSFLVTDAGSPASNSTNYPLNQLASVDNTCRWTYDFTPLDNYPGMCPLPATPTPTPGPVCTEDIPTERECIAEGGRWGIDTSILTHVVFKCFCD